MYYVFVTVGSEKAMHQGMSLLRRAGKLVLVGMPASGVKLKIEAAGFTNDSLHLMGSKLGSTCLGVDVPGLVALYENGRLKLDEPTTHRYPLEQINEAVMAVSAARRCGM